MILEFFSNDLVIFFLNLEKVRICGSFLGFLCLARRKLYANLNSFLFFCFRQKLRAVSFQQLETSVPRRSTNSLIIHWFTCVEFFIFFSSKFKYTCKYFKKFAGLLLFPEALYEFAYISLIDVCRIFYFFFVQSSNTNATISKSSLGCCFFRF